VLVRNANEHSKMAVSVTWVRADALYLQSTDAMPESSIDQLSMVLENQLILKPNQQTRLYTMSYIN
jgi:hypothetical protein